jgi:hypothetical protein
MGLWNILKKKKAKPTDSTELQPIGSVLKADMQHFYEKPCAESVQRICDTLITVLAQKDYVLSVPFDSKQMTKDGFHPLMLKHGQFGEAYKAYTGLSGYGLDDKSPIVTMSALAFFEHIAKDSASGLILDHECGHNSNVVLGREDIFRILFAVRYLQKTQKKQDSNAIDEEFVFAEKGLIYNNIATAIKKYNTEKTGEAHTILCQQLVYAVLYNVSYRMEMAESPLAYVYAVHQHEQVGPVYTMFTSMDSAITYSEHLVRFARMRTILDRVIADDVNGLVIDGSIYLSKENVKNIVKYGYEQIELQPPVKKKFMLEEM